MAFGIDPLALFRSFVPTRAAKAKTKRRSRPGALGLGFETLESRQMMAADMAEIVGTIRLDTQNDGNPANDALVQGAIVKLYRDGGDGQFNSGAGDDVIAAANVTSNNLGQYRFAGLGAGKYFVQIQLPAGLQTAPGGALKTVTITAPDAAGAVGSTIDEFDSFQKVEASPPPDSAGVSSTKADATVLGGERDFRVEITGGTDEFSSVSLISAGGLLRLASGAMVTGNATIVWDGQDGNPNAINPTGLGGLDFTKDGPNRMTGIRLSVGADHPNSVVKLRIYSDATHWSEFTTTVPESTGGAIDKQVVFDFANPSSSGGGGADFTKVGAIELTFVGVNAVDAQISVAELVGLTTKTADFTALSNLSVGDQVWQDANNNGMRDGAEQGIAGVVMNLYADTDNNNAYTPGIDVLQGTAVTDSAGKYLFANLVTGSYVVQVDGLNFEAGGALAGLKPSTG
ncbi:MAG TPA: SdrD B-like domain-containing protein, partial [Lacipirellulaceae bacterium]|nr:SdrD B-like domain-containing protein [Lacipirellulaceae bacterium]